MSEFRNNAWSSVKTRIKLSMIIEAWCETDVGLKRESNEDSFLINKELGIFAVADGMGGHRGGEVASSMAIQTLEECIKQNQKDTRKMQPRLLLSEAYKSASIKIFDKSRIEATELAGMGTTLVSALYFDNTLFIANVGDSRAYLYRSRQIWQLTEDHSLLNEHIKFGLLNEQDADNFLQKNVITRSVGFEREVVCDILERLVEPEDLIILCSDGLSGMVTDSRIAEICQSFRPDKVVEECIREARNNGGDDNITALAIYARPQ